MAEEAIVPGSRYDSANPVLLNLQAPTGVPRSSRLASVSDPLGLVPPVDDQLSHFWPGLYNLSPESHLARLLKTILGDAGVGAVSKQFTVARLQSMVMTTRYLDLDRLYGGLLGMRRMAIENLGMSPYLDTATPDEWDVIDARDASYRSRVEAFSRSLSLGGTPDGMAAVAQAVTGVECRVHESYLDADEAAGPGTDPAPAGGRTYGDVQTQFIYYGFMRGTYADIEAGPGRFGGSSTINRARFTVVPRRVLTLEETHELTLVLRRLKPAGSLLSIDPRGVAVHRPIKVRQVLADSTYWEVTPQVAPLKAVESAYSRSNGPGVPTSQARPAFSGSQGEDWSYNGDVASVVSYTLVNGAVKDTFDYQRVVNGATTKDYTPDLALSDQQAILAGRMVSAGVLTTSPFSPTRGVPIK